MTTAQVLAALEKLGITRETLQTALSDGTATEAPQQRQRPRGASQAGTMTAPRQASRSDKPKAFYGTAPAVTGEHNVPDAVGTHRARLDALEQAMPGFTKVAYVFSVGKNAANKLETNLRLCVNNPFTYIELPGGKNQAVGEMTPEQVRAKIKACGYGFTRQRDAAGTPCAFWACDSNGRPVRRQHRNYRKRHAAAMLVANDSAE